VNSALSKIVGLLLASSAAFGQSDRSLMACVTQLTVPMYPPIAVMARVQGETLVTFKITPAGTAAAPVASGPPMLRGVASQAVEQAHFDPQCAGQSFTLIVRFELTNIIRDGALPLPKTIFLSPNSFNIISDMVYLETNP
jgi:hypothetical protein